MQLDDISFDLLILDQKIKALKPLATSPGELECLNSIQLKIFKMELVFENYKFYREMELWN